VIKRKTVTDRLSWAITRIGQWCRISPRPVSGSTGLFEASGALRVLRDHRELMEARTLLECGHAPLALLAQSAIPAREMDVGAVHADAAGTPAAAGHPRALNLASRSESVIRGAGCPNWARPDLQGGLGGQACPGLPDTKP
jgi:hypothetical protein